MRPAAHQREGRRSPPRLRADGHRSVPFGPQSFHRRRGTRAAAARCPHVGTEYPGSREPLHHV